MANVESSLYVQLVSKSFSEKLLFKYFDASSSEFEFDYEESALWSPLITHTRLFLHSSSTQNSYRLCEMLKELKKAPKWFRKYCTISKFNAWGALPIEDCTGYYVKSSIRFIELQFSEYAIPKRLNENLTGNTTLIYHTKKPGCSSLILERNCKDVNDHYSRM